jgi:hypothetical protein
MSQTTLIDSEAIAQRAEKLYHDRIRQAVESPATIGKMVIIDVETENYAIDEMGLEAVKQLRLQNPNGQFFGIRIGYNVGAAIGGIMERTVE